MNATDFKLQNVSFHEMFMMIKALFDKVVDYGFHFYEIKE